MYVRPAALKAGTAISARIVGLSSQDVLTRRVAHAGVPIRLDNPQGIQAHRNGCCLSIRGDSPGQLFIAEVFGNGDRKNTPLAARKKMRRLTSIGTAGLDLIVWAGRNIEQLLLVSIEVTEQETIGAVRILKPAFEGPCDALPAVVNGIER